MPRRSKAGAAADAAATRVGTRPVVSQEVSVIPAKQAVEEFLGSQRIAVTGVSRTPKDHGANVVYKRLRDRGYSVFAVNPNADRVEGDTAYHDLKSVPGGVDGVLIATSPAHAEESMREAVELGVPRVWMHRGPGVGSVSEAATAYGRAHGVTVIEGGCPCMFGRTADFGHKVMRSVGVGHMGKQA